MPGLIDNEKITRHNVDSVVNLSLHLQSTYMWDLKLVINAIAYVQTPDNARIIGDETVRIGWST